MQPNKFDIEPCPDCPVPTNFIIKPGEKQEHKCLFVECRECGDKWTEIIDNEQ